MPTDPRILHPRRDGETAKAYAARLTGLRWPCACGCGRPLAFYSHDLRRSLYRARHNPSVQAQCARRGVTPAILARKREASRALWTEEKRRAWSEMMRRYWQEGRYALVPALTRDRWRRGDSFGGRRWRGGIRAELLARFPEHAGWIRSLTEVQLAGLLATHEETSRDVTLGAVTLRNLFGEDGDDAAA